MAKHQSGTVQTGPVAHEQAPRAMKARAVSLALHHWGPRTSQLGHGPAAPMALACLLLAHYAIGACAAAGALALVGPAQVQVLECDPIEIPVTLRNDSTKAISVASLGTRFFVTVVALDAEGRPSDRLALSGTWPVHNMHDPVHLPPGGSVTIPVDVRRPFPVLLPGRYRVAAAALTEEGTLHHTTLLVVSADDEKVRAKLARLKADMWDEYGNVTGFSDLSRYDARFTLDIYIHVLERQKYRDGEVGWAEECLQAIGEAIEHQWTKTPEEVVARLAAFTARKDTKPQVRELVRKALGEVFVAPDRDPKLAAALEEHFHIADEPVSDDPDEVVDLDTADTWSFVYLPRATLGRGLARAKARRWWVALGSLVIGLACGGALGVLAARRRTGSPHAHLLSGVCLIVALSAPWCPAAPGRVTVDVPPEMQAIEGLPILIPLTLRNHGQGTEQTIVRLDESTFDFAVEELRGRHAQPVAIPAHWLQLWPLWDALDREAWLSPGDSQVVKVNLRKWTQVIPAGRYRVTMAAMVAGETRQEHTILLTVTSDASRLRAELQRIEAGLLDPRGDFMPLWDELGWFDPRYTVDAYVRVLGSLAGSPAEDPYDLPPVIGSAIRIRAALELGWAADPDAVLSQLAAIARHTDTQEWVAREIESAVSHVCVEPGRADPKLVAALKKHFNMAPRVFEPPHEQVGELARREQQKPPKQDFPVLPGVGGLLTGVFLGFLATRLTFGLARPRKSLP